MRSAKLAGLLLTTLALLTNSCSGQKEVVRPRAQIAESQLTTWPEACEKGEEASVCKNETLSWVFHTMVDLYYDREQLEADLVHQQKTSALEVEACQSELDGLTCKWWFWMIVGGAAAAAATAAGLVFGN